MKKTKNKTTLTPIGTKIQGMTLIKHLGMIHQESESRRCFLLKCDCGHEFKMINRYFLRSEYNRCPQCPKGHRNSRMVKQL